MLPVENIVDFERSTRNPNKHMKTTLLLLCAALTLCSPFDTFAQSDCKPPEITVNRGARNIFSEEAEVHLGDVVSEYVAKNYRVISDAEANRYVRQIGDRLVQHLPPTTLKFQIHVVDLPTLNAFAAPGGRIYITRKMIAFVRSEDELAGIIGHELGHAIVRHGSIDMSRYFEEVLGVKSVGGRDDIYAKYHELIEKQNTKRIRSDDSHEGAQQQEADKIGLFAMIAAGYDPTAFVNAWDRLADTRGKTGSNWGIFGGSNPNQKRLKELMAATASLPAECKDRRTESSSEEFQKWQSFVTTAPNFERTEKLPALIAKRSLQPALRSDIIHFQFSPNGEYLIAQDESGINVVKREPFHLLFRIDTANAKFAKFSPDSKNVVFSTYGLRVEMWDIAQKAPVFARELFVRGRCWQTEISPDGKTLACYSGQANLELINVADNETIFTKKEFYVPSVFEYYNWSNRLRDSGVDEVDALQMDFSPDGRHFLGGKVRRGLNFNFSGSMLITNATAEKNTLAYDISQRKELKVGGELKNVLSMPYAFYSNDQIIGQHFSDPEKSGIFKFPSGERVDKFLLNANSYTKPHVGDYIFVRPTTANPVGVYHLKEKKFIASNKTPAMDGYGDFFVSESRSGVIGLFKRNTATTAMDLVGSIELPKSKFSSPQTISLAPDMKWLALSERSRGAVWELDKGEMKIFIRGFTGSFFDSDAALYADFPRFEKDPRVIGKLDPVNNVGGRLEETPKFGAKQFGKYMVRFVTKKQEEVEKKAKDGDGETVRILDAGSTGDIQALLSSIFNIRDFTLSDGTLEVTDVRTGAQLWRRYYPNEAPRYRFDSDGNTAVLYWRLSTKTAKEALKTRPELAPRVAALGEKTGDYLVEVVDASSGRMLGQALIETGEGSFSIDHVFADADWLTLIDSENRVLLYSLKSGELRWRFFGENAVINVKQNIAIVENIPGQLAIYDLSNGQKTGDMAFAKDIVYTTFSPDGTRFFVLSNDQEYYIFDTAKLKAGS